jgi:ATP-dependent DNA ligase
MIPEDELFPDMKGYTEDEVRASVADDNEIYQRKYDGTASAPVVKQTGREIQAGIIGRGVLKSGERQEYSETFYDLLPSIHEFLGRISHTSFTLVAEIVCLDENGDESFKAIEARCNRKKDIPKYAALYPAQLMIFDIIELDGKDLRQLPQYKRREILEQLKPFIDMCDRLRLIDECRDAVSKQALVDKICAGESGIEGIVVKNRNATYGENTRKFKYKCTEDVFWEGEYEPGNNRHTGKVGSLICYQYLIDPDTGVSTKKEVARIGGGIDDPLRVRLTELALNKTVNPENPMVIATQTHELLPSGKMRYPNWISERFDKGASQCTRVWKIVPTKSELKKLEVEAKAKAKGSSVKKSAKKKVVIEEPSLDDWL